MNKSYKLDKLKKIIKLKTENKDNKNLKKTNDFESNIEDKRAFKILCSISIFFAILIVVFNAWVGPSLVPTYKDYQRRFLINLEEDSLDKVDKDNKDNIEIDDEDAKYFENILEDDDEPEDLDEDLDDDIENTEDIKFEDDFDEDGIDKDDVDKEDVEIEDGNQDEEDKDIMFINVNQADLDDLIKLPGIGEVLAKRIIDYRSQNGPFNSKEDLLNVDGIGESRLELISDYIFFD